MSEETVLHESTIQATHDRPSIDQRKSQEYFERVSKIVPTGFTSMGRQRTRGVAFKSALAGRLTDIDGNEYIDLALGLGPVVIGHSEPDVTSALHRQVDEAFILGGETPHVLEVAERMRRWIPCAEHMVFTNTGSEAVQVAMRIARASMGRSKIIKFEGHYHGWLDPIYSNTPGIAPGSPSVPEAPVVPASVGQAPAGSSMIVTKWNDIEDLRDTLRAHAGEVAAVIMEPVPLNFGSYIAGGSYLSDVRDLCTEEGVLLIFDEVVSGFRLGRGGAQGMLGVTPDLGVFAKAIGGGVPMAMVAGTTRAMRPLIDGSLGHVGTYNGNPLSMAAANAVTQVIEQLPDFYEKLELSGARLQRGIQSAAQESGAPLMVNRVGSVLQLLWNVEGDGRSYSSCMTTEREPLVRISDELAARGVYAHPRGIIFLSYRHSESDLDDVVQAYVEALAAVMQ